MSEIQTKQRRWKMGETDVLTHEERIEELNRMLDRAPQTEGKRRSDYLKHVARLFLIYKPFPVVRRLGTGSALPWGGTIVGDTFYGTALFGHRRGPKADAYADGGYGGNLDADRCDNEGSPIALT